MAMFKVEMKKGERIIHHQIISDYISRIKQREENHNEQQIWNRNQTL